MSSYCGQERGEISSPFAGIFELVGTKDWGWTKFADFLSRLSDPIQKDSPSSGSLLRRADGLKPEQHWPMLHLWEYGGSMGDVAPMWMRTMQWFVELLASSCRPRVLVQ